MSDGASFSIDGAALDRSSDRIVRQYLTAGTKTVGVVTKQLERDLEAATQRAVPGRLWRAWTSNAFPKSGPARNPAGTVFVNGGSRTRGAIKFWTEPGTVKGKSGQYLAIPLPAAGARGRARDLTPGEWEQRTGRRLRFVYRQGRASLLVADDAVLSGRGGVARGNTAKRTAAGRGSATVPIFVLLPMVKFRNAFAVAPIVAAAEAAMAAEYLNQVSANEGR